MKNKSFLISTLLILLLTFSVLQIYSIKAQEVIAVNKENRYVTRFDADEMVKKHLTDFNLLGKRAIWNRGRMFEYQNNNAQKVSILVGLHPSANDAEVIALDYLNYISMAMKKGPIEGESIGDKLWWWSPSSDPNNVTNIVFIRKNALFIISSHSYKKIKALAKAIDEDIINRESYTSIEKSISPPMINSISMEKSSLQEGDLSKITVKATDMKNESLEYQFLPGLTKNENDQNNVFTFIASRDYVAEPFFGLHTIKCVVINESNVVSRVSEIKVNCIE